MMGRKKQTKTKNYMGKAVRGLRRPRQVRELWDGQRILNPRLFVVLGG
jgi:hypothetical protein